MRKKFNAGFAVVVLLLLFATACSNRMVIPPFIWDDNQTGGVDEEQEEFERKSAEVIWYLSNYLQEKITNIVSYTGVNGFAFTDYTTGETTTIALNFNGKLSLQSYLYESGSIRLTFTGKEVSSGKYEFTEYSVSTPTPIVVSDSNGDKISYSVTVPSNSISGTLSDKNATGFSEFTLFTKETSVTSDGEAVDISEYLSRGSIFDGGDGKTEDTPYLVSTSEQFRAMMSAPAKSYFKLESDLILPVDDNFGYLTGVLDGNNKTITLSDRLEGENGEVSSVVFQSMRDGSAIKNITFDIGEADIPKTLIGCSSGKVELNNVRIEGRITADGNNIAPFVGNIGYDKEVGGDGGTYTYTELSLINCVNAVDIIDSTGTHWGLSPFISGNIIGVSGNISKNSITLDGCKNEGTIIGGEVGWAVGNGSNLASIGSFTMNNCSNSGDGKVIGFLKAGDISGDGGKDFYTDSKFVVTNSSPLVEDKSSEISGSSFSYTEDGEISYGITPDLLSQVSYAKIVARYNIVTFVDLSATVSASIGQLDNLAQNGTAILNCIKAVTNKHTGLGDVSGYKTGDTITVNSGTATEESYIFIEPIFGDGYAYFIDSARNTVGMPSSVFMVCYNANDEIVAVISGSKS